MIVTNHKDMSKTLVVYGSTTGSCEDYAGRIAEKIDAEVVNVSDIDTEKFNEYDHLILGTSTWGAGELQDDWYDGIEALKAANLQGKTVAIFGCGDAESYSDTFCGGMAEIYNTVKDSGAKIIGQVDASTYTFDDSEAVVDGQFVGLAIDVNEDDANINSRIENWTHGIKEYL
jgi:flavodoxin I